MFANTPASNIPTMQGATNRGVEISFLLEKKYNPFSVAYLGGIGYTSTKRIEVDIMCMSAFNAGSKLF